LNIEMKHMKKPPARRSVAFVLLIAASLAGCATSKQPGGPAPEKDISRIVKLADGTTCVEPAGLSESRQKPGAAELRTWLASNLGAEETLSKAQALNLQADEAEAVYFDACRAYSNGALSRQDFDKVGTVYFGLRRQYLAQGVKQWLDKKDGIAEAGKLCLVMRPGTDPDRRSFTRVVPAESSVNDCAQLAIANGSTEIQLGCTQGQWQDRWAKRPIALGNAGARLQQLTAKGTPHAPDPDCGWD
jgi:hypothetical protein